MKKLHVEFVTPEASPERKQSPSKLHQPTKFNKFDDPIDIIHQKRMKMPGNILTVKASERMAQRMGIEIYKSQPQ